MSLMNYLGAVASAAVEAASAAGIQGPIVTGTSTSNMNRNDGPTVVTTTATVGNVDSAGRTSLSVPQGLSGFPVVPITIHHSGPSGQIAYAVQAISNGSVRLAHPHMSGPQRTFTVHPASVALAGQVPAHFSLSTGTPSQSTVEIRLPPPPTISSQVTPPVGSHLVDKPRSVFQASASYRFPPTPTLTFSQPCRPIEQELRRDIGPENIRLKPSFANLNTSRPSVLMGPRSNGPREFMPHTDPAIALSIVLQDHNYTLPKRLPPASSPASAASFQPPQDLPSPALPQVTRPINHRPVSPPNKIHPIHSPALHLSGKPPPLYSSVRGSSPPIIDKSRRPRSSSPVNVPGSRRRKTFEKNQNEIGEDFLMKVPGRKRARKQTDLSALNNTIPPYPVEVLDPLVNSLRLKSNISVGERREGQRKKEREKVDEITEEFNQREVEDRLLTDVPVGEKEEPFKSSNTPSSSGPEDSNNEGITRCICDYLHDDGFMIACDNCYVWQHVDCMGIDRKDIPDGYLCELCKPRWVSKTRARAIQTRKKEMLELGVLDESTVGDSDHDNVVGEKIQDVSRLTLYDVPEDISSAKSSGKLKRRGRPSLSNGQPFSDSDTEIQSTLILSPNAKRSRKFSGKRGPNLIMPEESPSKIGTRKRRSVEPKRSYTRRNTLSSPLSSPGIDDMKSIEDLKENSLMSSNDITETDDADGLLENNDNVSADDKQPNNDTNGILASNESRRKRKQIFKDIPNGDLSPPHIITPLSSSSSSTSSVRSPISFDKTPPVSTISNNTPSSPEPVSNTVPPLHININVNSGLSCPYSFSPFLEKYEEAVNSVCSYSPDLRAKLLKNHGMGTNSVPDFAPITDDTKKWKLGVTSLEGGKKLKTLLAAVRVEPGEAVVEFIGKFLMLTGFIPTNKKATVQVNPNSIAPEPFVFFHQVPKNGMCICIDCRKYGNDARFVRRSCTPNAEIRHVVGKGTIHAYVVATAIIDLDEEVTIPHEFKSVTSNITNSVVQKYHVVPSPLPCACSDLETCKANDPTVDIVQKKNGALVSPTSVAVPQEIKERKRRMSSRRTSSVDNIKEQSEVTKVPVSSPPPSSTEVQVEVSKVPVSNTNPEDDKDSSSPSSANKDRSDGRTTRARSVAIASEETTTVTTTLTVKRKSESIVSSRQRNRSGADTSQITQVAASNDVQSSDSHKMTREERKLQSVLKIIEKMESNQKKKESRQNQKKDKVKEKKSEDRESDHDDDLQSGQTSANLAPVKFSPSVNKKKGRKRGRSTSGKPSNKPQMIIHRNSGSIADMRSVSTESDFYSADESLRAGMSPLQENVGPNFRLPKKKVSELMSEWRIGCHPSPIPSQYMRKVNAVTPPVQPSTSSHFLAIPIANGNLDNASAKKRWLRQAISEEIDPPALSSPNSRPNSPVGVECLAPLKKRRLARASMSSEVSNTPPSTPYTDNACSEMDAEVENETEQTNDTRCDEEILHSSEMILNRKWSCSEVSSADEEVDESDEGKLQIETTPDDKDTQIEMHEDEKSKDAFENQSKVSPSATPRRSRWDQVDAPEPMVNTAVTSPVKTSDAIVLDYVRNPEQYAKLTGGVAAYDSEKGNSKMDKESSRKASIQVKKKLSMEEYFKRKMEGKSIDERPAALSNSSTALNSMTNIDSNSSDTFTWKEPSSPKTEEEPKLRRTLQFSSMPTLAERKREELGRRLSKSFGIRVPEADTVGLETVPAPPTTLPSPRDTMFDKQKLNGDIGHSIGRNMSNPLMVGHRLSVPTPAALKQSGMPPLPPHLSPSPFVSSIPNGANKSTLGTIANGYGSTGPPLGPHAFRNYRVTHNGPTTYGNHQQPRSLMSVGQTTPTGMNSSTAGQIIGGVPVGNLIPPPPPPTSQGTSSPAFGKRFYNKKFFPSS